MSEIPCSGSGNTKVGRVWTFSLPALITCPGSSPWCCAHCYALRLERLRPNCREAYTHNLRLALDAPAFVTAMLQALPDSLECLRLHVSGDFHQTTYIEAIREICATRPSMWVWGYTRSWRIPALRPALDRLRELANVQLMASVDATMPPPPSDWHAAFVSDDPRAHGLPCPQQHGLERSCLACGYCFRARQGNVVRIH